MHTRKLIITKLVTVKTIYETRTGSKSLLTEKVKVKQIKLRYGYVTTGGTLPARALTSGYSDVQ